MSKSIHIWFFFFKEDNLCNWKEYLSKGCNKQKLRKNTFILVTQIFSETDDLKDDNIIY